MEGFAKAVKSRVFPLSNLDFLVLTANIQFIHIYENRDGSADFMPQDILKRSFYKALQQFPIFVGHVREVEKNKFHVVVDKHDLNMPEYNESTSNVLYSKLEAARFSWDKWPKDMAISPIADFDSTGINRNLKVDVVRLKDSSGLIISLHVPHCLVDGVGYFAFINQWADTCKEMRRGGIDVAQPQKMLAFDRNTLKESLPKQRKTLDPFITDLFAHSGLAAKCLAKVPLLKAARLSLNFAGGFKTEAHMFHISRESLDRMHGAARDFLPGHSHISDNDLIAALLYKTLVQCEKGTNGKDSPSSLIGKIIKLPIPLPGGGKEKDVLVSMASDSRPHLGSTGASYMGNATITSLWKYTFRELDSPTTPESLATTAKRISLSVGEIDSKYVGSILDLMDSTKNFHANACAASMDYCSVALHNHSHIKMYNADFGNGVQKWVSYIPGLKHNVVLLQPCPPGVDGVNVFVETAPKNMENMRKNEYWMGAAELLY